MSALPRDVVAQIRELRYLDGHTQRHTAEMLGVGLSTVRRLAPGKPGKVPVAPLREAFLASGMRAADVARAMGWMCERPNRKPQPDSSRVLRTLGIRSDSKLYNGRRIHSKRTVVDAETVQIMAETIGISPWAVLPDETVDTPVMVAA